MLVASWSSDLTGLTPLILGCLFAAGVVYFRREIKDVIGRVTQIEAKRKDTSFTANMRQADQDEPSEPSIPADKSEDPDSSASDPIPSVTAGATDADTLRATMIRAYLRGDKAEGKEAFEKLATVEKDPVQIRRDQILRSSSGFIGGVDPDGLEDLEKRATDPDIGYFVNRMIGACLTASEKPSEALLAFQKSIDLAQSFADKAPAIIMKAEALEKAGEVDQAVEQLGEALDHSPDDRSVREDLWAALASAYKSQEKLELRAAALHRVAELAGNDSAKWFRAAYAYSEAGEEHLTIPILHCYQKCIFFNSDHQYARNNIGVLLQRRNLPVLAVSYYKEDAEGENTLSMGNLAGIYLRAGFVADAEELLTKAEALPEPDEKVARVRAEITSVRIEEDKKLEGLKKSGSQVGQFLTRHIRATNKARSNLGSAWTQNGKEVEVEASASDFLASWSVSSYRGGRRFKGSLTGYALTGSFETEGPSWGGEPAWTGDGSGYGIVSDDGREIELLKLKPEEAEYIRFRAAPPSP